MDNSFIFLQIFSRMRNTKPWCSTWTRVSWWRRAWMTPFFPSSRKSSSSGKRRRRRRRRSWGRPRWSLLNVSSSHFGLVLQLMSTSSAILWGPRRPSVNSTRSGEKKKILDKFFLTTHLPPSISGQSGEIYKLDLIFQVFFFQFFLLICLFIFFCRKEIASEYLELRWNMVARRLQRDDAVFPEDSSLRKKRVGMGFQFLDYALSRHVSLICINVESLFSWSPCR